MSPTFKPGDVVTAAGHLYRVRYCSQVVGAHCVYLDRKFGCCGRCPNQFRSASSGWFEWRFALVEPVR